MTLTFAQESSSPRVFDKTKKMRRWAFNEIRNWNKNKIGCKDSNHSEYHGELPILKAEVTMSHILVKNCFHLVPPTINPQLAIYPR